jgi:hypothetical protein
VPSVKGKCLFRVTIAREDKVGNPSSIETNCQIKLQFYQTWSVNNTYCQMHQERPLQSALLRSALSAIKACVYHKIMSLQFFGLHFSCIFTSPKPAKPLFLLIHPQFSNIVIFGEERKLWSSSMRNSLLSHNTCFPFGPRTVFSTSFSDIKKDLPKHTKIS